MESEVSRALRLVPDDEVLRRLEELVSQSRRVDAELVAHIGEVDERRLFARFAFPSMFAYCTQALHLSEAEAYRRITVARVARRFPVLFEMLRDGRLHLSGIAMLAPLLTPENHEPLLARAVHLSKRQLEELTAELSPPNVKGWPGGEAWINTTTLLARKHYLDRLVRTDDGMPPAAMPDLELRSPKLRRGYSTAAYARNVLRHHRECLARLGGAAPPDGRDHPG